MTTTYATLLELTAKWSADLSELQQVRAQIDLEEGSALLRRLIPGLDAAIALGVIDLDTPGAVDPIMVRKVLTDAIMRVMRWRGGVTSQTIGPESASFSTAGSSAELQFLESELALITPASDSVSVNGSLIGSIRLGRPYCDPYPLRWC